MEVRLAGPGGGCPTGPGSVQETFAWYEDAQLLLSAAAKSNLKRNVDKLFYSSHCSGMGCLEQIMHEVGGTCLHASDILSTRQLPPSN